MPAYCPDPPPGLRRDRALAGRAGVEALHVVYVGQAAAVLATRSGTLVPVTAGPACLAPGGIGVPDRVALGPVLARWSELAGDTLAAVDLRGWHAAATAVELRIPAVHRAGITAARITAAPITAAPITAALITAALFAELDRGLPDSSFGAGGFGPGERAEELARLAREAHAGELGACVAATVGAGMGTTPAGDDVICGVLAGLDLLGFEGAHRRLGAAVATRLSCTTRSSRHLLAAAAAGRYTEGLIGLAAALVSASAPAMRTALAVLRRWGASSGLDQATGFAAAIRAGAPVGAGAR